MSMRVRHIFKPIPIHFFIMIIIIINCMFRTDFILGYQHMDSKKRKLCFCDLDCFFVCLFFFVLFFVLFCSIFFSVKEWRCTIKFIYDSFSFGILPCL